MQPDTEGGGGGSSLLFYPWTSGGLTLCRCTPEAGAVETPARHRGMVAGGAARGLTARSSAVMGATDVHRGGHMS